MIFYRKFMKQSAITMNMLYIPWKSKDYFLNGFSVKTIVLVVIYHQQFKGTILFMVFDFQGISVLVLLMEEIRRSLTS